MTDNIRQPWYKRVYAYMTETPSSSNSATSGDEVVENKIFDTAPTIQAIPETKERFLHEISEDLKTVRYHIFDNALCILLYSHKTSKPYIQKFAITNDFRQVVLSNGTINLTTSFGVGPFLDNDYERLMLTDHHVFILVKNFNGLESSMMKDQELYQAYYNLTEKFVFIFLDASKQINYPSVRANNEEIAIMENLLKPKCNK